MKNTSLKNKFVAVLLLALLVHTGIASSFSMGWSKKIQIYIAPGTSQFSHSGALGAAAWATDVFRVDCPAATTRLETQIFDLNPVAAPLVSVQAIRKNVNATNSTDPSEDAAYSPLVSIAGGAGIFYVLVDKSSEGAELYAVDIMCKNSADVALSTTVTPIQDN
jgi:hypothetical protein